MIIEEWMEQQGIMAEIQECLVQAPLRAKSATWDFQTDCSEQVIVTAETQSKIRWINFIEVKMAKQWQLLQQQL